MPDAEPNDLASFVHEVGHLKRVPRSGWSLAGVVAPESVAEHSFRVAVIAFILADLTEGADPNRAAVLGLFHDVPEARTLDIPSVGKRYHSTVADSTIIADQTSSLPPSVRDRVTSAVRSYAEQDELEARLAHDADKLECLAQALEYRHQGHAETELWIQGSYESVTSRAGIDMADALMSANPHHWWATFVSDYRKRTKESLHD